jgi:hypothetical protein
VSIWTIAAKVIGLIPAAVEAGAAIAKAFTPKREINPMDMTLWHTVSFGRGLMRCVVCEQWVQRQNELCPEEVRRRQAI